MSTNEALQQAEFSLVVPCKQYQNSYHHYITALGDEERYPFPLDFEYADFSAMLRKVHDFAAGRSLPENMVPSSTFWLVKQGEIVGVTNLRHYLNDSIRHIGGHIGLSIKPTLRGQGLSKILLNMTLHQANELGIKQVHVHCYESNMASAKMIESCGGVLDSTVSLNDNQSVCRYVIY